MLYLFSEFKVMLIYHDDSYGNVTVSYQIQLASVWIWLNLSRSLRDTMICGGWGE